MNSVTVVTIIIKCIRNHCFSSPSVQHLIVTWKITKKYELNMNFFDHDCVYQNRRAHRFDQYPYYCTSSYHQYIFIIFSQGVVDAQWCTMNLQWSLLVDTCWYILWTNQAEHWLHVVGGEEGVAALKHSCSKWQLKICFKKIKYFLVFSL